MKALDYFLIICAIVLLGLAYFISKKGDLELAVLANFSAIMCGVALGARLGGRMHNKNSK